MKRNIFWILATVLFIAVFAYFAAPLFKPPKQGNIETEPFWVVETSPQNPDYLKVFEITLNESELQDLIYILGNRLSLSLFVEGDQKSLEGYIRETHIGGLTARIPFTLQFDESEVSSLMPFLTASKMSTSKRQIYEIPEEYHGRFMQNKIENIAFIPMAVNLDETVILGRFGDHPIKLQEKDNGPYHYLYPEKGVDISLDAKGEYRAIVQYITPAKFDEKILKPLIENGAEERPLLELQ